jgi:hypothetical protein
MSVSLKPGDKPAPWYVTALAMVAISVVFGVALGAGMTSCSEKIIEVTRK